VAWGWVGRSRVDLGGVVMALIPDVRFLVYESQESQEIEN
jgi:hypothetical protein